MGEKLITSNMNNLRAVEILQNLNNDSALVPLEIRDWWINYLHAHFSRYIEALSLIYQIAPKNKKILEIGSMPGHFTILLKKLDFDIEGVDISPERLEKLWDTNNIKVSKADIEIDPLPIESETFDVVVFTEILEHLRINPLRALREIYRILGKNGTILLSTPNITPLDRVKFLLGKNFQDDPVEEFKKLEWLGHMGHIRLYSLDETRKFLEAVGFHPYKHEYGGIVHGRNIGKVLKLFMLSKGKLLHKTLYVMAKKPD